MTETTPTILFDKDADYGTVHGDPVIVKRGDEDEPVSVVAVYEQDGFLFDAQLNLIPELLTDAAKKRLARRIAERKAKDDAAAAYAKAMADAGIKAELTISVTDPNAPDADAARVDLVAWAEGRKKYRFDLVSKTIRELFDVGVTSKNQALELLAVKGLIPGRGAETSLVSAGL
jgi:hypothetical protein